MTRTRDLFTWRGPRDDVPLDPERMQFTVRQSNRGCRGCMFERQWGAVCKKVGDVAARAGLDNCDDGFIYEPVEQDARQIDIIEVINAEIDPAKS